MRPSRRIPRSGIGRQACGRYLELLGGAPYRSSAGLSRIRAFSRGQPHYSTLLLPLTAETPERPLALPDSYPTCCTEMLRPATVTDADLKEPSFASPENRALPLPTPVAPSTTFSHGTLLLAVQEHVGPDAAISKVTVPPTAGTVAKVG